MEGKIKSLVKDKGYGFIAVPGKEDVFFHRSSIERPDTIQEFYEGDRVEFEVGDSPKGPRAENVRRL